MISELRFVIIMHMHMHTSVAPIIGSAIGIGQYQALTGISAVYLDLAYRYLVFKHEL